MGLDARVCCDCIKKGSARPHPFPRLLGFDKTGEPTLTSKAKISADQWGRHDEWHRHSCPHSGYLVDKRLGNIAFVARVREFLARNSPHDFPILHERVVYSGSHCGDWITVHDARKLLKEAKKLKGATANIMILKFADDCIELAEASIATGNPIIF